MKNRVAGLFSVVLCFMLSVLMGIVTACGGSAHLKEIKDTIASIRSGNTVDARAEAAEHLADLVQKINRNEITKELVTDIISLMDSPDDSVRYEVATALGNLGPAAKVAIPKLLAMLPDADCINGAITSAGGIRLALMKMGVAPPPRRICKDRIAG